MSRWSYLILSTQFLFLYSFIDVHYPNLTLSALNVHAGAYIQYDVGLGDDLSKDGTLVDESIISFPEELVSMHLRWWKATLPPSRKNMKLLDLWKDMYKVHRIEEPTAAMRSAYGVSDQRARINLLLDEAE